MASAASDTEVCELHQVGVMQCSTGTVDFHGKARECSKYNDAYMTYTDENNSRKRNNISVVTCVTFLYHKVGFLGQFSEASSHKFGSR